MSQRFIARTTNANNNNVVNTTYGILRHPLSLTQWHWGRSVELIVLMQLALTRIVQFQMMQKCLLHLMWMEIHQMLMAEIKYNWDSTSKIVSNVRIVKFLVEPIITISTLVRVALRGISTSRSYRKFQNSEWFFWKFKSESNFLSTLNYCRVKGLKTLSICQKDRFISLLMCSSICIGCILPTSVLTGKFCCCDKDEWRVPSAFGQNTLTNILNNKTLSMDPSGQFGNFIYHKKS